VRLAPRVPAALGERLAAPGGLVFYALGGGARAAVRAVFRHGALNNFGTDSYGATAFNVRSHAAQRAALFKVYRWCPAAKLLAWVGM